MTLLLIFIFLVLSAFFSGAEIAYVSADKLRIRLKSEEGDTKGKLLSRLFKNPQEFIGAMLVGNNIALVVFTFLTTELISPYLSQFITNSFGLLLFNSILITIIVLLLGEFLPKTIFRIYAEELLYFFSRVLIFFYSFLWIPSKLMSILSNFLLKHLFRVKMEDEDEDFSRIDLSKYVLGETNPDDEELDKNLFEKALQFNTIKVNECMVPRTEIASIDVSDSITDLIETFKESNFSRIIVVENDIDNILGYVHHQHLWDNKKSIKKMIVEVPFIPETMDIERLLEMFTSQRINIACVVDEFGGTAGIVTIEDILEEIFGEIEDEHDKEAFVEEVLNNDEFLFSGRLEIDYLNEKYYKLDLPEGDYHTLSGYIVTENQGIPKEGQMLKMGQNTFILESVSDKKIEKVRVILDNVDVNE